MAHMLKYTGNKIDELLKKIDELNSNKLATVSYVDSLYLKKTDASSIYADKAYVNRVLADIGQSQSIDLTPYATKIEVANWYAPKTSVDTVSAAIKTLSDNLSEYLKIIDADSIYMKKTDIDNAYLKKTDADNLYIKSANVDAKINDALVEYAKLIDVDNKLTGYATETYVQNAIANISSGGSVDLSGYLKATDAHNTYLKITDASNIYATKTELDSRLADKVDKVSGSRLLTSNEATKIANIDSQIQSVRSYVDSELANKVNIEPGSRLLTSDEAAKIADIDSQIQSTKDYVDSEIAKIQPGVTDLTGYATETYVDEKLATKANIDDIPKTTSELLNDSNFAVQPNFTYKINMIDSAVLAYVTTTGTYPDLTITFNIPKVSEGEVTDTGRLWIGYIPFDATGAAGYNTAEQIGAGMTIDVIKFGMNGGTMEERDPIPDSNTSGNLIVSPPESSYMCVIYPKDSGLKVTADNGLGTKVPFSSFTGNTRHQEALQLDNQINGITYLMTGMSIVGVGNYTIYIDKEV